MIRVAPPFVAFAAIVSALTLAPPLRGQIGVEPGTGHSLHLELARPSLDDPGLFPQLSAWTADLTVVVAASERVAAFGRVGYVRASIPNNPSSATISHPRLGVVARAAPGLDVELHVDLPMLWELGDLHYATTVARIVDYERLERFWPDTWSVGASIVPWKDLGNGFVVGARAGAAAVSSTADADGETLLGYAGFMRFPIAATEWDASLSGIVLASEEGLTFAQRSFHFGYLSITAVEVPGRPALFARVPVDTNLDHLIDWIVGARAEIGW